MLDVFHNEVGIAAERLTAIGHGAFKPLVENDSEDGRANNRRVEIKVRHKHDSEGASPEAVRQLLQEAQIGVDGEGEE